MAQRWTIRSEAAATSAPPGLFTKDAETIARVLATKKVSPKGLGSAIRTIQFLLNRAGRNLPARRRRELERAKRILQEQRTRRLNPSARSGSRGRGQ